MKSFKEFKSVKIYNLSTGSQKFQLEKPTSGW